MTKQRRLPGFRFDTPIIRAALEMRHNRLLTYRDIADRLSKRFGVNVTYKTVYMWVKDLELREETV